VGRAAEVLAEEGRALLRNPPGSSRKISSICGAAWARGSVRRSPAMWVPLSWMTGLQAERRTVAPVTGRG
jgi:hypothetical protein